MDKFVVIVAHSRCRKGPHKGTLIISFVVGRQEMYGKLNRPLISRADLFLIYVRLSFVLFSSFYTS